MIDYVIKNNKTYAIIIRSKFSFDGIKFFTPENYSQQLGYMKRKSGYKIMPHIHNPIIREVELTQEVLVIKSGKVRVDFYDDKKEYFESQVLNQSDVILLAYGGHGFEMLEETEMIEIKQGPYSIYKDKIKFQSISEKNIKIR